MNAGQAVPAPLMLQGVIDTGSDVTAVPSFVLQKLGISSAQKKKTQTASGSVSVNMVEISLSIVGPNQAVNPMFSDPALLAMELPQPIPDVDVIVGLDVLLQCQLFIDGPARQFTLTF